MAQLLEDVAVDTDASASAWTLQELEQQAKDLASTEEPEQAKDSTLIQEDMAIDTDASTSASTEQTDHASLRLASMHMQFFKTLLPLTPLVLDVEYKVRFLILVPPQHERMQLLKTMLPLKPPTALAAKSVLNYLKLKLLEELEQEAEETTSIQVFLLEYKVRFLILAPPPHERMQLLKKMLQLTPATALAAKSVLNCLKLKLLHLEELEQEAEATTSIQEENVAVDTDASTSASTEELEQQADATTSIQENMAVDTDASTSASTEVFLLEYKVRFLILAPPPHELEQEAEATTSIQENMAVHTAASTSASTEAELEQEAEATTSIQDVETNAAQAEETATTTLVQEFAAARELREIDGAAILAPVTTDPNDDEAEIVENVTKDDVYAKLEETQKTVARLSHISRDPVGPAHGLDGTGQAPLVMQLLEDLVRGKVFTHKEIEKGPATHASEAGCPMLSTDPCPDKSSVFWFPYKVVIATLACAFVQGSPKRRIAALDERLPIIPLISDNQGNIYSLIDSTSRKMPSAAILIELMSLLRVIVFVSTAYSEAKPPPAAPPPAKAKAQGVPEPRLAHLAAEAGAKLESELQADFNRAHEASGKYKAAQTEIAKELKALSNGTQNLQEGAQRIRLGENAWNIVDEHGRCIVSVS
ncbi:hypothetical protein AK812_SmicGene36467 [Symbiodinium microadriaticum]|uniref:Uncharacterized protein n=1 Tax=Symbiodinium microadriaticum TaxID=2951 RepID=A0A1Q9CIZ8_SYMMI|nr:hypothetical protein AK812_SmicGene36467 [Symbiodinium microadriaticum]